MAAAGKLLTTREAAKYLSFKPQTLNNWRTSGEGPVYLKLGGSVRYLKSDLDQWIADRRKQHT